MVEAWASSQSVLFARRDLDFRIHCHIIILKFFVRVSIISLFIFFLKDDIICVLVNVLNALI